MEVILTMYISVCVTSIGDKCNCLWVKKTTSMPGGHNKHFYNTCSCPWREMQTNQGLPPQLRQVVLKEVFQVSLAGQTKTSLIWLVWLYQLDDVLDNVAGKKKDDHGQGQVRLQQWRKALDWCSKLECGRSSKSNVAVQVRSEDSCSSKSGGHIHYIFKCHVSTF